MITEEINDGIALLEDALNTNLLNIPITKINVNKLLENIVKQTKNKQKTNKKQTNITSSTQSSNETEYSNVTGDSLSTKTIIVPSEYFSNNSENTESFFNLAHSNISESNNDAKIMSYLHSINSAK
jgi:hypothetical protein